MKSSDASRPSWVVARADALGPEVRSLSADDLREASRALASERAEVGLSSELTARALAFGREALSRGSGTDVSSRAVAAAAAMTAGTVAELRSAADMAAAAVLACYWCGVAGEGVHVVTADDQRAREQHALLAPLMDLLGGNAARARRHARAPGLGGYHDAGLPSRLPHTRRCIGRAIGMRRCGRRDLRAGALRSRRPGPWRARLITLARPQVLHPG